MAKKSGSLNDRQAAFVREYLVDLNATRAAIRAGYAERSAAAMASELLRNPKVQEAVEAAQKARADRVQLKADDVLVELARLATSDVADAFDEHGALRPLKDMPVGLRRAIASIEVEQLKVDGAAVGTVAKVRMWDKPKSLELLSKHLGLLKEKLEVTGKDGAPVQVHAQQDLSGYTDEELQAIHAIHEAAARRRDAAERGGGEGGAGEAPEGP
jgi:phage terminase small subunit